MTVSCGVNPDTDSVEGRDGRHGGCDRAGARDYAAFLGFFSLDPS